MTYIALFLEKKEMEKKLTSFSPPTNVFSGSATVYGLRLSVVYLAWQS